MKVYDVSGFHKSHPVGGQVTDNLGKDGTETFKQMHSDAHLQRAVLKIMS